MQIVIPSSGRAATIEQAALKLFPNAIVCIDEQEEADYKKINAKLLLHPSKVSRIGPLRQWIIENVKDEIVVQVDDDVFEMYSLVGITKRTISDPKTIYRVIETTALCAKEAGARIFGFNQAWDVRKFRAFKPFSFISWAGGVVGIIGKDLKYDVGLKLRADIDFCLQSLMKDRILWSESRYSFLHKRWDGQGGNAKNRSSERHQAEMDYLKRKWGKYISFSHAKTAIKFNIHVQR